MYKVYICLLACAATRALHLEFARDLCFLTLLQAFCLFVVVEQYLPLLYLIMQRGCKGNLRCDMFRDSATLPNQYVHWLAIYYKKGPWWGGFQEQLVKDVKHYLKKAIGRASLTVGEMSTVTVEIKVHLITDHHHTCMRIWPKTNIHRLDIWSDSCHLTKWSTVW